MSKLELARIPMNTRDLLAKDPTSISDENLNFNSPHEFWEHVYLNYIEPRPQCSSCEKSIDKPSQWISFTCKCQKYYHKRCIYEHFDILICPGCRDSKQIYAFPRFLCKFMNPERYYQIYNESIKNKDSKVQLQIYKLWFQTYSIYTPPFLNLYDHISTHDPYATIEYLESKKNTHKIECYDPAFTVEDDGMTYNTDLIDYYDKQVFVDLELFKRRFQEYSYDLIELDKFPFNDHVILAAGAVHKCLESRIDLANIKEYSNIDIFICHPDSKILTKDAKKCIKYLQDRHGENIFWVRKNTNVLRCYIPGFNRMIQLVIFKNTIENIVSKFDFSHVQFVYDGKTIKTTLPGLEYAKYLVSTHDGYYDIHFPKRFQKAKDMNLCIALPMADSMTLNIPRTITIHWWYPNYTDDLEMVKQQMIALSGVRGNYITKTKPCRILYSKIPEEFSHSRFSTEGSAVTDDEIVSYIEHETLFSTMSI